MNADRVIIERERKFWTSGLEFYEQWLARDVLMVFPAPIGILRRADVLRGLRTGNRWTSVEFSETSLQCGGPSTVFLAYCARARKLGEAADYVAWVGSAYVEEGGEWKLGFHQHTPAAGK